MLSAMIPWISDLLQNTAHHVQGTAHMSLPDAAASPTPSATYIPDPGDPSAPPGSGMFIVMLKWVKWGAYFVCVVAFIGVGVNMTIHHHRGEGGRHFAGVSWILIGVVFISGSTGIVATIVGLNTG